MMHVIAALTRSLLLVIPGGKQVNADVHLEHQMTLHMMTGTSEKSVARASRHPPQHAGKTGLTSYAFIVVLSYAVLS